MSNTFNEGIDIRIKLRDAQQFRSEAVSTAGSIEKIGAAGKKTKGELHGAAQASDRSRTSFRKLGAAAIIAGAGLLSIGAAKSAITTTVGLATSSLLLSKNLGLTNTEASGWAAIAKVHGIATRSLWMSFSTLSKTLNAATGGTKGLIAAGRAHLALETDRLAAAKRAIVTFKAEQLLRLAAVRGNQGATVGLRAQAVVQLATLQAHVKAAAAIAKLASTQVKATAGNKGAIAALKELGITQADLQRGSTDYHFILHKVLDALDAMPGGARKAALAQKLLGRGAVSLMTVMAEGKNAISENMKMAKKYGVTLSGSPLQQMKQFRRMQVEMTYAQLGWQITFATKVAPALTKLIGLVTTADIWLRKHKTTTKVLAIGLGVLGGVLLTVSVATKIWAAATTIATAAQWLLNIALDANPIVLIVLALVALGVAIVILYKKWALFRHVVTGIFDWIKSHWKLLAAILIGPFGVLLFFLFKYKRQVEGFIMKNFDAIIGFVKGLGGRIKRAAGGMWDGVKDAFRHAINWILGKWNHLHFGMKAKKVAGVTIIPGFDLHAPQIPLLAQGGTFTRSAIVGEEGPELASLSDGKVQVTPLSAGSRGVGGSPTFEIHVHSHLDGREVARSVTRHTLNELARS